MKKKKEADVEKLIELEIGTVVVSDNLFETIHESEVIRALERHRRGDWGLVNSVGEKRNITSLEVGGPVFSFFESQWNLTIAICTKGKPSTTFIALDDDPIWIEIMVNHSLKETTH